MFVRLKESIIPLFQDIGINFVCEIEGKHHTIGYVVSELVEMHAAIDSGSILSVEFSWVHYITDWSRLGPGFFAGVNIGKRGKWSETAVQYSSTR